MRRSLPTQGIVSARSGHDQRCSMSACNTALEIAGGSDDGGRKVTDAPAGSP